MNLAVGLKMGLSTPMMSDAEHYLDIAKCLAAGQGYSLPHGFWPDVPTISRSPAWPFTVSLALRLFPSASPDLVMRCLALLLNTLVAVLVALLARQLLSCSVARLLRGGPEVSSNSPLTTQQPNNPTTDRECGTTQQPSNLTTVIPAIAGMAYAVYPTPLYLAYNGASEMLFLVLTLAGTLLLLRKDDCSQVFSLWSAVCGLLLLGLACLVRPNFILWIGFAFLLVALYWLKQRRRTEKKDFTTNGEMKKWWGRGEENVSRISCNRSTDSTKFAKRFPGELKKSYAASGVNIISSPDSQKGLRGFSRQGNPCVKNTRNILFSFFSGFPPFPKLVVKLFSSRSLRASVQTLCLVAVFMLPSALWAYRNYQVCGHFPVFSTLRGQTFYGGNNDVVSGTHDSWGYWIFPDQIPGEPKMEELAKTMSEYGVDCYYYDKGKDWVRTHVSQMPGLMVGKLVRAYVPVPWKPTKATVAVSILRWILYVAALAGVILFWRTLDLRFKIILGAMILTNVATVAIFWGCARFAFAVEPFLIPAACAGGAVIGYKLLVICKIITPTANN